MALTITKDHRHNNQMGYGNMWRRGMTGRDHLSDPHAPNCMNFELQKWPSWAGDMESQYKKTNNNQLPGSNSLRECMAWQGRINLGM
jgi:hypothetical protein